MKSFLKFTVLSVLFIFTYSLNFDPKSGYENVIVELTRDSTSGFIDSEQEGFFNKMSDILHVATKGLANIKEIIFVLPVPINGIVSSNASWEALKKPDIIVTSDQSSTFHSPFCGEQGEFIRFSITSQKDEYGPKNFVQQFAKYRYGIFDETPEDQECFFANENWHLTGCYSKNHREIRPSTDDKGLPKCGLTDLRDMFHGLRVDSSIAFSPKLPEVTHFCDDTTHIPKIPTIQNALCSGKSTWEVIKSSQDFKGHLKKVNYSPPKYRYVHDASPRIVFIVPTSGVFEVYESIRQSLEFLVQHLMPDDFEVGVIVYSDSCDTKTVTPLTQLISQDTRKTILENYEWVKPTPGGVVCPEKSISQAILLLEGFEHPDTIIIMGEAGKICPEVDKMREVVPSTTKKQRILAIVFVADEDKSLEDLKTFTQENMGTMYPVPSTDAAWTATRQALASSINTEMKDYFTMVHHALVESESKGIFYTEAIRKGDIVFHGTCKEPGRKKKFIFDGEEAEFDHQTDTFTKIKSVSSSQVVHSWTYEFELSIPKPTTCDVIAFFRDEDTTPIVRIFTKTHKIDSKLSVLGVYVKVPVERKIEKVVVTAAGIPKNEEMEFELNDRGDRDPDFTEGDGVFSNYFYRNSLDASLFYTLSATAYISVASNEKQVIAYQQVDSIVIPNEINIKRQFPPSRITKLKISSLNRDSQFTLEWIAPGNYLNTEIVAEYDFRYALDQGELLQSFEAAKRLQHTAAKTLIHQLPGQTERVSFKIPTIAQDFFYVAIRGINEHKIKGSISNIIQVVPEIKTPETASTTSAPAASTNPTGITSSVATSTKTTGITELETTSRETPKLTSHESTVSIGTTPVSNNSEEGFWTKEMVIVVCASSFGGFALILVIINVIVCYCIISRRRKANDGETRSKDPFKKQTEFVHISYASERENSYEEDVLPPRNGDMSRVGEEDRSSRDTPPSITYSNSSMDGTIRITADLTRNPEFNRRMEDLENVDYCFPPNQNQNRLSPISEYQEPSSPRHQELSPVQLMHQPVRRYTPTQAQHRTVPNLRENRGSSHQEKPSGSNHQNVSSFNPTHKPIVRRSSNGQANSDKLPSENPQLRFGRLSDFNDGPEAFNPAFQKTNNRLLIPSNDEAEKSYKVKRGVQNESFDYGDV